MLAQFGEWQVPADELPRALKRRIKDLDRLGVIAGQCKRRRVVVQAGANWGAWPAKLAGLFETVYCFEPEPRNFILTCLNTAEHPNVVRFQAALGDAHGCVGIATTPGKSGTAHVDGAGPVPVLRIDDLGLEACDAILLDVEGYEIQALRGAYETIARCRPVLLVEDKGWASRYGGGERGSTVAFAQKLGYKVIMPLGKDFILVPR